MMFEFVSFSGGVFLVLGAWFLARGNVFASVGFYFIADVCWVLMAVSQGAYWSAAAIMFGMLCGLYVFFKMHRGQFRRSIQKDVE